jgi:hypothetical protein
MLIPWQDCPETLVSELFLPKRRSSAAAGRGLQDL